MRLPNEVRQRLAKPETFGRIRTLKEAVPLLASLAVELTGRRALVLTTAGDRYWALLESLKGLLGTRVAGMEPRAASPYLAVEADSQGETERLGALARFLMEPGAHRVLVAPLDEYLRFQLPPKALEARCQLIMEKEILDRVAFTNRLSQEGYLRNTQVEEQGSFAVRGGIIDIWPGGAALPVRLDLFGDEVESIHIFNPDTQLGLERVEYCMLPPARLLSLDEPQTTRLKAALRRLAGEQNFPSRQLGELLRAIGDGQRTPELEMLYPEAFEALAPLDAYLDGDALLVLDDGLDLDREYRLIQEEEERLYQDSLAAGSLVLPPARLLRSFGDGQAPWNGVPGPRGQAVLDLCGMVLDGGAAAESGAESLLLAAEDVGAGRSAALTAAIRGALAAPQTVVMVCENLQTMDRSRRILGAHGLGATAHEKDWTPRWLLDLGDGGNRVQLVLGNLEAGLVLPSWGLMLVSERAVFGRQGRRRRRDEERNPSEALKLLSFLQEGDLVVHHAYGVARYAGMERRAAGGSEASFLVLEYKEGDRLFIPVYQADRIHRYIGGGESSSPPLDRLGAGTNWDKKKDKARSAAKTLAVDLLKIYAQRKQLEGYAFSEPDEYFEEFEASFPYEETADQRKAIEEVLADMEKAEPMDRLVCGDVGFGKTEVAIRAAFKAVLEGKQVAVLVPTTVLAQQHKQTFAARMAGYPVRVDSISRFKDAGEQKLVMKEVAEGKVDVLVGTHSLLRKGLKFRDLGLLIIDEEHKFGVNHKEKLKEIYPTVDVLSLTATPIPRTMHMALSGIRDISVIASPPQGRHAIDTKVIRWDDRTIADAIRMELDRGGQVFFLHNNVKDLESLAERLTTALPDLKIGVAHGQMNEGELEKAMVDFAEGRAQLLLCTTIIESGLDLPGVNTLIVNNAHCFGLAQLYQIRGRVGRGTRQAHAFFVVPPPHAMTDEARKRLAALQRYTALGSGFTVASMDLEIRGAGELLGANQSGNMTAVGYDLFVRMVEEEVGKLRSGEKAVEVRDPEIRLPLPMLVPDEYMDDKHLRLMAYRRIAGAQTAEDLTDLYREMENRFGPVPKQLFNLFSVVRLKQICRANGVGLLEYAPPWVRLDLSTAKEEVQLGATRLAVNPPCPLKVEANGMVELKPAGGGAPLDQVRRSLVLLGLAQDDDVYLNPK